MNGSEGASVSLKGVASASAADHRLLSPSSMNT